MRRASGAEAPIAVTKYLLPREYEMATVRQHPAVLIGPSALTLAGLLGAGVLSATVAHGIASLVLWLAWLLLFLWLVWKTANWAVDYFVVTTERLLLTTGVFTRRINMMPLTKVTDMSFRRSFPGRLLGYGEFIVESAGQDQALRNVPYIPYPEQLYLLICGMIFPESAAAEEEVSQPGPPDPQGPQSPPGQPGPPGDNAPGSGSPDDGSDGTASWVPDDPPWRPRREIPDEL